MKLYCTLRSPYARKVRMLAIEKGVELELIEEDLAAKSSKFLGYNPVGRVPVLTDDDGLILSDSTVICDYLEKSFKDPCFLPEDSRAQFKVKNLDAVAKGLTDVTVAHFYERLKHPDDANKEFLLVQEETIRRTLTYFEQYVDELKELNLASVGLLCAIGYIRFRVPHLWPREDCPGLNRWHDNQAQRESFKRTVPKS